MINAVEEANAVAKVILYNHHLSSYRFIYFLNKYLMNKTNGVQQNAQINRYSNTS